MKAARVIAIVTLVFLGLSALVGAVPMIMDPWGGIQKLPLSLLDHTPFRNFLIPGLILLFCNGVLSLLITIPVVRKARNCGVWVAFQGCVIFGWITVQVIMIRGLSWLHFLYWGVGVVLMACGWVLHRHAKVDVSPALHAAGSGI